MKNKKKNSNNNMTNNAKFKNNIITCQRAIPV